MTFDAVASVCDTGVPAIPVTPRLRFASASAGVTVRDIAPAKTPSAVATIVYVEVVVSTGAVPEMVA